MISKNSFVKIMNSLRDYNDELCKDMKRLGVVLIIILLQLYAMCLMLSLTIWNQT